MSIRQKLAASGVWTIAASVLNNFSSFVVFAVLTRVLTPREFGVVAYATIFVEVGRTLVVAGISDALVQRDEWDQLVASTGFWVNLCAGVIVASLLWLSSAAVSGADYDRQFGLVLGVLSLDLVVEGFTAVHTAKLRRDFRYKELATRGMTARVLSSVVGVVMAYDGAGVWALVVSRLISSIGLSIALWRISEFRPSLKFSVPHARGLTPFAANQLGSQMLAQLNAQAGALVVGAFLGPVAIAQYRVGSRALNMITSLVISPLQQTALSGFSRVSRTAGGIADAYQRMTRVTSFVASPTYFGIVAVAPDLIRLLFGPNWNQAGAIMAILCLFIGPATLSYFQNPALSGAGRANLSFWNTFLGCAGNLLFALIAAPFGALLIAVSQVVRPHVTLPLSLRFLKRGIGLHPLRVMGNIAPYYLSAALMCGVVMAERILLNSFTFLTPRIMICGITGALFYLGVLRIFAYRAFKNVIDEIGPLLPSFIRQPLLYMV